MGSRDRHRVLRRVRDSPGADHGPLHAVGRRRCVRRLGGLRRRAGVAVPASPRPHLAWFTSPPRAADYLLEGRNPYAGAYVDIYAGTVGYPPGYPYPPGVLLPEALARWLLGDIRWALIAADAVTVLGLSRIAGRLGAAAAVRWWLPLLWLSFPAAPFSREQAWVDPLLIAAVVAVVALLIEQRLVAAGAALGYACSVKQYAIIAATLVVV